MIVHMIPQLQGKDGPVDRSIRLAPVFGSMGVGVLWSLTLWTFERKGSSETWLQKCLGAVLEVELEQRGVRYFVEGRTRSVIYTQVSAILVIIEIGFSFLNSKSD
jgi:hypothetical protein